VTPISTATNTPLPAIPVGSAPEAIAITPNGETAYVGVGLSLSIVVPIDTATNTVLPAITVPGGPRAIAITP